MVRIRGPMSMSLLASDGVEGGLLSLQHPRQLAHPDSPARATRLHGTTHYAV
jgi:hypothetical protein